MKKISIISYSGGLDSTSLLLHLLNKQYTIYALSFDYGQKHKIELEKAQKNIKYFNSKGFNVKHKILNISDSIGMLDSSLTNSNVDVPSGYYKEENMKSTVVPNRNAIFLSFVYGFAITLYKQFNETIKISLGVHSGDHAIYPDCRIEFYDAIFKSFKIGNWDSENIELFLPYINKDKSDIINDGLISCKNLGLDFNMIYANTLTSYNPNKSGISNGETASDIERILAFNKIGMEDPLKYNKSWNDVLKNAIESENKFNSDKAT